MKKTLSMVCSLALMLTMLFGMMVVPASASNAVSLTLTDTAGELGDTVEVSVSVSENSYLVNGDFDVYYDTDYLRYIPESCEATALLDGAYWAANSPIEGEVRMSFASGASVGITAGGALFTMKFEIINKDSTETRLTLNASPLCGCNGGEDFDLTATISGGQIGIVGGADPWNFLQEAFLESGQENVSIDENGVWSVTGDFTLSPDFTMNYNDWSCIAQKFTTNTPVKITLVDNDPLGVYGKHEIGLYDNFVGPQYYPAKAYDQVNSILGIYSWNIKNSGWKNTGVATIDQVIVHFETSENVAATFTSLYMCQSLQTTSSVVRTTATKPSTTTTTQVYDVTYTVETVQAYEALSAGDTFTVDITVSEIEGIHSTYFELLFDAELFSAKATGGDERFGGVIHDTVEGKIGFSLEATVVSDIYVEPNTVLATVTFTALKDITEDAEFVLEDVSASRYAPGAFECIVQNGGLKIVNPNAGDVTGDGVVNLNDATSLFYHVNGLATLDEAVLGNADLNEDGKVDLADATALFYQVNGLV
ncbi:MAG: hypothetical protein E7553_02835 [Ruminococcaceae bacterium]|nr:hypothetical protein [Oscillospiraceae bacterium]